MTYVGGTGAGHQQEWYDAHGNATRCMYGSQDITLTYDADGNRVKSVLNGETVI